ncbi:hypothetical protein EJ05DRAFT_476908 [Pseudovirgaria hyperparasitica]|uniref:Uncharacterized protein n=1 Tax=Pseudovirgaria hyperparasitica TaxID=470096 RepID=A0A6A6W496_9PEZI|nr:uncharacterized protein EJ05DRAFT_476908 [Pseudovirgaria hyperparasitica]KAF2757692.1 hypothetical protein EJ05DRAFT_476908 [Pseudovirgaria hyperparasitica]
MMLQYPIFFTFLAAVQVYAVPLNINLGAYSPALVVGDGEISLGGAGEASTLMSTLATGAADAAQANGQGEGEQGEGAPPTEAQVETPTVEAGEAAEDGSPAAAIRKSLDPSAIPNVKREVEADGADAARKLKIRDFKQALDYAKEAMTNQPKIELGTGEGGSGVGVVVGPGINVPVDSAANGAQPDGDEPASAEKLKRDAGEIEETKRGVTLLAMVEL